MIVKTKEQFKVALDSFTDTLVVDTETPGLDIWGNDRLCGIGICNSKGETFYFPYRHRHQVMPIFGDSGLEDNPDNLPIASLPLVIEKLMGVKMLIGHNIKFDIAVLHQDGFEVSEDQELEDTMVLGRLYSSDKYEKLNLEALASRILKEDDDDWKTVFKEYLKKNKIQEHYDYGDIDIVGEYCEGDVLKTWKIRNELISFVIDTGQMDLLKKERELLKVLWDMEKRGMYIDMEYLHKKLPLLEHRTAELEEAIYSIAGCKFDINSTKELGKVMNSLGIYSTQKTEKKDEDQWNIAVLLAVENPIGKLVLQYREVYKMLNTYFLPFSRWESGYIHTSYRSGGTATGRMSCANPNLQNVMTKPIDVAGEIVDEKVQEIFKTMSKSSSVSSRWIARITKFEEKDTTVCVKRLFTAPKGYHFYAIDFSQMEMRVFSDYVGDPAVISQLEEHDFDFHSFVAKEVWGSNEDDPNWKFYRSIAKAINFGMIYGIGVGKLATQIDKTLEEAKEYKDNYFRQFPSALRFMNNVKREVCRSGFITNKFGRRYYIPYDKSYTGVNYLVQGSSADLVKDRMIAIHNFLKDKKTRMVAQIHDELIFYVHDSEEKTIVQELKTLMEERKMTVLLPTEASKGFPSWSEKHSVCLECGNKQEKEHICQTN